MWLCAVNSNDSYISFLKVMICVLNGQSLIWIKLHLYIQMVYRANDIYGSKLMKGSCVKIMEQIMRHISCMFLESAIFLLIFLTLLLAVP